RALLELGAAALHEPVEGVDIGAGARLDHVGGAALAADDGAVEVHLDGDLADGVLAAGHRAELVVDEPALEAGDGLDRDEHGVDRAVPDAGVLEPLALLG